MEKAEPTRTGIGMAERPALSPSLSAWLNPGGRRGGGKLGQMLLSGDRKGR
uniref:Uncharacterized protein n=1 Tax=Thermogemmatispora argillosa TaxID=2045280 RepID=A0A455T3C8_9CHLR|nr:hypothetical protein KTA_19900 [Thermogemmatispora argillosa]